MSTKSQIGVRALIISGDGLVVVEHEEKGKRLVVFPGGGLEEGETIFEGAMREVKEETNLEVVPEQLGYVREVVAGAAHGIEFYVICRLSGGEMSLGVDPEHEDGNEILKAVRIIPIGELATSQNWYPTELRPLIAEDFRNGFSTLRSLGTARF